MPGTLGDLDIAPDGSYLLVTESVTSGGETILHRVSLDGAPSADAFGFPLGFYEAGTSDVVIVGDNVGLVTTDFAGSGWTSFRRFDGSAADPGSSQIPGLSEVRGGTYLIASEDDRYALVLEGN